jgi:formylglycine-generating enzyme required for sulfatase activity
VIEEPARRHGYAFERDAMVDRLVAGVGDGGLPLLSFTLSALWARRDPARRLLPEAALDAMGGVGGALAGHADRILDGLDPEGRSAARVVLGRLVTPEGTRARVGEAELLQGLPPAAATALGVLVDGRLVVADQGEGGAVYAVAHEALLAGWPTLRAWLAGEAAARVAAASLGVAAGEWERLGRGSLGLLGERRLREAAALPPGSLGERERALVAASRAAGRRRRAARVLAPLVVAALVAAALLFVRWRDRRADEAYVAARLAEAAPSAAEARSLEDQAHAARGAALVRFDADDFDAGLVAWRAADGVIGRGLAASARAAASIDAALARSPNDARAHAAALEVSTRWFALAELTGDDALAEELRRRVRGLAGETGEAPGAARAVLRATTVPPGGSIDLVDLAGARQHLHGARVEVPAGSYVLEARAPDRYPTRLPALLRAGEERRLEVPQPRAADVPAGMIYVPAGTSILGERVRPGIDPTDFPEHDVFVEAFLIGRDEVTVAEYAAYLQALPAAEREAQRLVAEGDAWELGFDDRGPFMRWRDGVTRADEPRCIPKRTRRRCQDWLHFPAAGISHTQAVAYAAWLDRSGRLPGARLCREREWERAARGADGRPFASGAYLHADENVFGPNGPPSGWKGLDEVGASVDDVSPFGVRDLDGNVREWLGDNVESTTSTLRVFRGGTFTSPPTHMFEREAWEPSRHLLVFGTRICAPAP